MIENDLQGLIMPPAEARFNTELWLGFFIIFSLILLGLYRWRQSVNKPSVVQKKLAQKKLNSLHQDYKNGIKSSQVDPSETQQVAIKVVSILCKGLGVNRLDQYQPKDRQTWQSFHHSLNSACYTPDTSAESGSDLSALFKEAKDWLLKHE
jgi:hypothetical protein